MKLTVQVCLDPETVEELQRIGLSVYGHSDFPWSPYIRFIIKDYLARTKPAPPPPRMVRPQQHLPRVQVTTPDQSLPLPPISAPMPHRPEPLPFTPPAGQVVVMVPELPVDPEDDFS